MAISNQRPTRPVFILSLPRSGSTLLQRILASHEDVATTAEPWILLPLLYPYYRHGLYAEYDQDLARQGIDGFTKSLLSADGLAHAQRNYALNLYSQAAQGARYFVDKTPRYTLIADEIVRILPDAKFVFLWRNPLAIIASILDSWYNGRWQLHRHTIDLFDGLTGLLNAKTIAADKALYVQYEELVTDPAATLARIMQYLELDLYDSLLDSFTDVQFGNGLGDRQGAAAYSTVSPASVNKWQGTLSSPLRKRWCSGYLRWIGEERLHLMGYTLYELLAALDSQPTCHGRNLSDPAYMLYGYLRNVSEMRILKHKLQYLLEPHKLHEHH